VLVRKKNLDHSLPLAALTRQQGGTIHPAYRFVARHSLFILPGAGFIAASYILSRMEAPWPLWAALAACMAMLWSVPIWRREKTTPLASADDLEQRIRSGQPSLLHFFSDF